jgi:hypothetical protein
VELQPGYDGVSAFKIMTGTEVDVRPAVARLVVGENLELLQLKDQTLSLEDIFIKVTLN